MWLPIVCQTEMSLLCHALWQPTPKDCTWGLCSTFVWLRSRAKFHRQSLLSQPAQFHWQPVLQQIRPTSTNLVPPTHISGKMSNEELPECYLAKKKLEQFQLESQWFHSRSNMIYMHDDQGNATTRSPENRIRNMMETNRRAMNALNENCQV